MRGKGQENETAATGPARGDVALPGFLAHAPLATAIVAPDGHIVDGNASFARLTGWAVASLPHAHASDVFGDAWSRLEAAVRWVALTHAPVAELEITARTHLAPVDERHWLVGLFPIAPDEQPGVGLTIVDITARERARQEIRVLARASALFARALNYDDALDRATRIAVPEFADVCIVHRAPAGGDGDGSVNLPEGSSVITAPMQFGDREHGAISFVYTRRSARRYRPDDVELAREIGRRIGQSLDTLHLREEAARANARLDLLARVGELLAVELDMQQRLRDVALMMLPDLGDAAGVYLVDDNELRLVAVGHVDPVLDAAIANIQLPAHALAAELPPCEAVRSRRPVLMTHVPHAVSHTLCGVRGAPADSQLRSLLCVPLVTHDAAFGVLTLAWHRSERQHDSADVTLALELARRIAPAVENARRYERDREVTEILQRSLLPTALPDVPGVRIEGRYIPGTEGLRIGGDWYDALVMPDGRLFLAIGDVVGHGVRAASAMGRMRIALQIYALEGLAPAAMLHRLNQHFVGIAEADMATLALLVLDPVHGTLQLASAGHPPPVLRDASGNVGFVGAASGPPVCALPRAQYSEHELRLDPGSTLVLYTDGLVERRGEALDVGLDRLAASLAVAPSDVALLPDTLLRDGVNGSDDVALLVVHIERELAPLSLRFNAHPRELGGMRHALGQWLERAGTPVDEREAIVLAVNEAATNSIGHAYGLDDDDIVVGAYRSDGGIEVSVRDFGSWRPARDVGGGRGLDLIRQLMDDMQITTTDGGTEVVMRHASRGTNGVRA